MRKKKVMGKEEFLKGPDGKVLEYPDNEDFEGLLKFVYEKFYGKVPEGKFINRKCDNLQCIQPEHMFLSDTKE